MLNRPGKPESRVRVGAEFAPLAPVRALRAGMRIGQLVGADDLWMGDHVRHIVPKSLWEFSPMSRYVPDLDGWLDPTAVISRYCRRRGPRMGVITHDAIRRTPADLARDWLTLHHLTGGNAVLGIGAGEAMNCECIGLSMDKAVSRLEDTLEALQVAFSANCQFVTHRGEFHNWEDASFPPPYRGGGPPIMVAAHGPRTQRLAGKLGDAWSYFYPNVDLWQAGARNVAAGAVAGGRNLEAMEWSQVIYPVLYSNRKTWNAIAASPLLKALCLILPGAVWTAAGLRHPYGDDNGGVFHYRYSDAEGSLLEGEKFNEASRVMTPDVIEQLLFCGSAAQVADRLKPFVEHGLSHVVVINWAAMIGPHVALNSYREQFKLNRLLKRMTPGSKAWALPSPAPAETMVLDRRSGIPVPSGPLGG